MSESIVTTGPVAVPIQEPGSKEAGASWVCKVWFVQPETALSAQTFHSDSSKVALPIVTAGERSALPSSYSAQVPVLSVAGTPKKSIIVSVPSTKAKSSSPLLPTTPLLTASNWSAANP